MKEALDKGIKLQVATGIYSKGLVKGRYFISKDLPELFDSVSSYAGRVFDYDRSKVFMGANFFYYNGYHVVFLLLGKKIPPISLTKGSVFSILPGFIVNFQGVSDITKQDITYALSQLQKYDVYGLIQNLTPVSLTGLWQRLLSSQSPPVEAIQHAFALQKKKCNWIKKVGELLGVFTDAFNCSSRSARCIDPVQARYKFIMSVFLICAFETYGNNFYNHLMKNDGFYLQAVRAEISYLIHHFGIKKIDSMFLRGYAAQALVQRTFKDLMTITSSNPSKVITLEAVRNNPFGSLRTFSSRLKLWLDYKFQPIGDPSAMGIVVPVNLLRVPESKFIIKINARHGNPVQYQAFAYEFAVGLQVNSLRKKVPNFLLTLGGFECNGDPTYKELCIPGLGSPINYMLLELVDSKFTMDKWFIQLLQQRNLTQNKKVELFFASTLQVMASLYYAQKSLEFTHYDLHPGNIMIYEYNPSG